MRKGQMPAAAPACAGVIPARTSPAARSGALAAPIAFSAHSNHDFFESLLQALALPIQPAPTAAPATAIAPKNNKTESVEQNQPKIKNSLSQAPLGSEKLLVYSQHATSIDKSDLIDSNSLNFIANSGFGSLDAASDPRGKVFSRAAGYSEKLVLDDNHTDADAPNACAAKTAAQIVAANSALKTVPVWANLTVRALHQIVDSAVQQREMAGRGKTTEIYLRIEPPELGEVRIALRISEERLTARIVVCEESTRLLFENRLPQLQQKLIESGIELESFEVAGDDGSANEDRNGQKPPGCFEAARVLLPQRQAKTTKVTLAGRTPHTRGGINLLA